MKKPLYISFLGLLCLLTGCGYSSNSTPVGVGTGSFSTASLNGQYVYQIAGTDFSSGVSTPYREAGVFTANGAGAITNGTDDFCEGSACLTASSVTGSYTVAQDGIGTISLSVGLNLSITIASSGKVYLIENDSTANATGTAEKQNTAALSSLPSGTFAFRVHTVGSTQGSSSLAGVMAIGNGVVTGQEDVMRGAVLDNGTGAPLTLTGLFVAPASNGRGTASITDSSGVTSNFLYYNVDANNVRLLSTDSGILGVGRLELQTGSPFSAASFSGGYAFGSQGDDSSFLNGVNTVGILTSAGDGSISAGNYDSVQDGNSLVDVGFTGNYTIATSGRVAVTLNPATGVAIQQVFWMVSPSRAFFLTNDSTKVEDGTADRQTGSFSNSILNGQYAFVMDGFNLNTNAFVDRVGWLQWDGAGGLKLNEIVSNSGIVQPSGILTGTYSVSSNGRAVATVNNLSLATNDLVFYLVSGSTGYMLQNDPGIEIIGSMSAQP